MTQSAHPDIPRAYNAADVERRVYDNWLAKGYFTPAIDKAKKSFTIIMPPPNVTGELHVGHALTAALEDALSRWHRMMGESTLWLPGKDHAGIATQWVVEQQLAREGTSRQELGREKFLEEVWDWVGKYGNTIDRQHQHLGASCDWSRLRFTLDPGPSKAVRTTFVNLYRKGLIYRHERIINWCPRCVTALSDLEVNYQEQDGKLYHVRYPMAEPPSIPPLERGDTGGSSPLASPSLAGRESEGGGTHPHSFDKLRTGSNLPPSRGKGTPQEEGATAYVTVATTRPETMLGDTGVAVHPTDPRYQHLLGRRAILPIMGRSIPVVGDAAVTPEFGTGALKVTPGHDPLDFDIGQRHQLDIVTVIGFDGKMTDAAGKYAGMDASQARQEVVAELERLGVLDKVEDYRHAVGHCQRCDAVVEPLVSLQWFVKVGRHDQPDSIAGRAHAAVAEGHIQIVPERFKGVYLNWLENIRDWCISRQLWWGHRIPVWYCDACGHLTVSVEDPARCEGCGSPDLRQDPDVLDTWFSSALWPHSTLGWPEDTADLAYFYPTAVLETGYDILFFWVARMIMLGLENTGQVPFRTVFLHGLIRDATGAKMSKTRGNVLDPLELISQYGTDALRFALTTGTAPGNDLRLTDAKLESARNFANKLWNAARYVMTALEEQGDLAGWYALPALEHREDRWIVSRLNRLIAGVHQSLESFELGEAQQKLYDFVWSEFCDWYIEMAKIRLRSRAGPSPLPTLAHVLERTLRLLHPFMPFITEEVWSRLTGLVRLPKEGDLPASIMIAPYPQADASRQDPQAEEEISLVMQAIRAVRNTRAQLRIPQAQALEAVVVIPPYSPPLGRGDAGGSSPLTRGDTEGFPLGRGDGRGVRTAIEEEAEVIRVLSRVEPLHVVSGRGEASLAPTPQPQGVTLVVNPLVVRLSLEGVVDLAAEGKRLREELDGCLKNLSRVEALVSNPDFRAKARPEVVEREEERRTELGERKQRLEEILAQLG